MIRFHISNQADQKFATILNNKRVSFRFRYNPKIDRWSFDLSLDGKAILHGRRVVPGADLLAAFNFGIGKIFVHSVTGADPNRNNLPDAIVNIYQVSEEEYDAAMVA